MRLRQLGILIPLEVSSDLDLISRHINMVHVLFSSALTCLRLTESQICSHVYRKTRGIRVGPKLKSHRIIDLGCAIQFPFLKLKLNNHYSYSFSLSLVLKSIIKSRGSLYSALSSQLLLSVPTLLRFGLTFCFEIITIERLVDGLWNKMLPFTMLHVTSFSFVI